MRRLAVGLAVAIGIAPIRAYAGDEPFLVKRAARAHYDLAGRYAAKGELRKAAAEVDAAYAIEPHPELLFVRAELRRRLDECATAVTLYREFMATNPSEAASKQAQAGIDACTPPAPEPEPEPAPEPAPAPVEPPPPPRPPWHRDAAGGALLGLGVFGVAAAGGLAGAAAWALRDAPDRERLSEYEERRTQAIAFQWAAGSAAVVGAALLVGAALRYRAVRQRERRLSAWLSGQGAGLIVRGRF
jgi:hypothetical protein